MNAVDRRSLVAVCSCWCSGESSSFEGLTERQGKEGCDASNIRYGSMYMKTIAWQPCSARGRKRPDLDGRFDRSTGRRFIPLNRRHSSWNSPSFVSSRMAGSTTTRCRLPPRNPSDVTSASLPWQTVMTMARCWRDLRFGPSFKAVQLHSYVALASQKPPIKRRISEHCIRTKAVDTQYMCLKLMQDTLI